jgi:hypothetical protein
MVTIGRVRTSGFALIGRLRGSDIASDVPVARCVDVDSELRDLPDGRTICAAAWRRTQNVRGRPAPRPILCWHRLRTRPAPVEAYMRAHEVQAMMAEVRDSITEVEARMVSLGHPRELSRALAHLWSALDELELLARHERMPIQPARAA